MLSVRLRTIYLSEHDIPIGPNTWSKQRFSDHQIADIWEAATLGGDMGDFKELLGHEIFGKHFNETPRNALQISHPDAFQF
ncbi:MAG: hypothetical protein R3C11_24715 [Planctomycetaceae bacterium]